MSPSPQRSRFILSGPIMAGLLGAALLAPVATAQTTVPENIAPGTAEESDDSGGLFSGGLLPMGDDSTPGGTSGDVCRACRRIP